MVEVVATVEAPDTEETDMMIMAMQAITAATEIAGTMVVLTNMALSTKGNTSNLAAIITKLWIELLCICMTTCLKSWMSLASPPLITQNARWYCSHTLGYKQIVKFHLLPGKFDTLLSVSLLPSSLLSTLLSLQGEPIEGEILM
jgi:hypothetical protein